MTTTQVMWYRCINRLGGGPDRTRKVHTVTNKINIHRLRGAAEETFAKIPDAMLPNMLDDLDRTRTLNGFLTDEEDATYQIIKMEQNARAHRRGRLQVRAMTTRAIVDELAPIANMQNIYDDEKAVDQRRDLLTNELVDRYKVADEAEEAWTFSELDPGDPGPGAGIIAAVTAHITDDAEWNRTRT